MIKAWLELWKNICNYKSKMTRKSYWLALIANMLAMYILVFPYALILRNFTANVTLCIAIYLVILWFPAISAYARRANDAGFHVVTTIYLAVVLPIVSGIIVGCLPPMVKADKLRITVGKIFALGFGLFFYGGFFGMLLYGDPGAFFFIPMSGLILNAVALIVYAIIDWRSVVFFFTGIDLSQRKNEPPVLTEPIAQPAAASATPQSKFCYNCGAPFADDQRFCMVCGTKRN